MYKGTRAVSSIQSGSILTCNSVLPSLSRKPKRIIPSLRLCYPAANRVSDEDTSPERAQRVERNSLSIPKYLNDFLSFFQLSALPSNFSSLTSSFQTT